MTAAVLSTAEAREVTLWSLARRGEVVHHGHRLRAYPTADGLVTLWDLGELVPLYKLTIEVTSATPVIIDRGESESAWTEHAQASLGPHPGDFGDYADGIAAGVREALAWAWRNPPAFTLGDES